MIVLVDYLYPRALEILDEPFGAEIHGDYTAHVF